MARNPDVNIVINAKETASPVLDKIEQRLKSLKASVGEDSILGNFGKLAVGAGAVAGVTMLVRGAENVAANFAEASNALARGEMSAEQMAGSLVKSIPIVGSLIRMGESLYDGFTAGSRAIEELAKDRAQFMRGVRDRSGVLDNAVGGIVGRSDSRLQAIADRMNLASMTDAPGQRAIAERQMRRRDATAGVEASREAALAEVDKAFEEQLRGSLARLSELDTKMKNYVGSGTVRGFANFGSNFGLDADQATDDPMFKALQAEDANIRGVIANLRKQREEQRQRLAEQFAKEAGAVNAELDKIDADIREQTLGQLSAGFAKLQDVGMKIGRWPERWANQLRRAAESRQADLADLQDRGRQPPTLISTARAPTIEDRFGTGVRGAMDAVQDENARMMKQYLQEQKARETKMLDVAERNARNTEAAVRALDAIMGALK